MTRARVEKHAKVGEKVADQGPRRARRARARKVTVKVGGQKLRTRTDRRRLQATEWKPRDAGTSKVRVRAASDRIAAGSKAKAGKVAVFRPAVAS